MKKNLLLAITALLLTFANIAVAFGAVSLPDDLHPEYAPVAKVTGNVADYGNYFLQLTAGGLLYLAAPVAVLFIAIGGFRYVISHGDQNQMEGAKKTLEWAIIGLVIIILAWAIVRAVIGAITSV